MTTPVTLISGYLGAGKTTLVNHLLRNANGLRLAILVNEFGELPIDADLIEAEDDQLISIAGGCVCCSFGDDLSQALTDLGKLDPAPEHVVIETSGVALPGSIVLSLGLMADFAHEGTIVLTNAETIRTQASDTYVGDTVQRQLADADLIVLNKTDLAKDADDVARWLSAVGPHAEILTAQHGKVPPETLLQSFLARTPSVGPEHHHLDGFTAIRLVPADRVDPRHLAQTLAQKELGVTRAKGFVTALDGTVATIQTVARRWDVTPAPANVSPGIVVIGQAPAFDPTRISAALTALEPT